MGVFRIGRKFFGVVAATTVILAVAVPLTTGVASASPVDDFNQCANGPLATPVSCTGNYQNGDLNPNNAHFREGDFVPYRVALNSLGAGSHTFTFSYRPGDSGEHAIDYLGSYDATETTSPTASTFYKNNNNPCSDLSVIPTAWCIPTSLPATQTAAVPTADFADANSANCGVNGTFVGSQTPGTVDIFGPPGTTATRVTYVTQNVSSGGGCTTTVAFTFSLPSALPSGDDVLITWGGHIASAANWGSGNAAGNIPGSPYHMFINSIDGTGLGSEDRAMKTTTLFFTPTISTQIEDASNTVVTSVTAGTVVHDTATLSGASASAGGTVTYNLFSNGTCTPGTSNANIIHTTTATVTNGVVANSDPFTTPGSGGSFSYQATYNGDGGQNLASAAGACEPLTVIVLKPTVSTLVEDSSNLMITNPIALGTVVHDTATLTGGTAPQTGTLTYAFYDNGACTGTPATTQTVTLSGGLVPNSSASPALGAGSYGYLATYNGDSNNQSSAGTCEPVTVSKATITVTTTLEDAATNQPWAGTEQTGAKAYDTAALGNVVSGFTPTGTVTYSYFLNGTCTGTPHSNQTVDLAGGLAPNSATTAALGAGSYSFDATYTDDSNYNSSATSACEPFSVVQAPTTTATQVIDEATGVAPTGTEVTGASFHDTATVGTPLGGIAITGQVTYSYFLNGTCSGTPQSTQTVTLAGGLVPNSSTTGPLGAGNYSFDASYGGDANYSASGASACEPFTVLQKNTSTATVVDDAATNAAWSGTEVTGASAYDTATVSGGFGGFTPSGTVTYSYFLNGTCNGTAQSTDTVTLSGGNVPNSSTVGPLGAGNYSFDAKYNGDTNYNASPVGACEPFSVLKASSSSSTVLYDATTNAPWSGSEVTGATAYDTSTVTSVPGFAPTGTVTYSYFLNGTCNGTAHSTDTVTISGGDVPNSSTVGPLGAGSYSFDAVYNGDANYHASPASACEPFSLGTPPTTTQTQVIDNSTGQAPSGSETTGAVFHDTATVGPIVGGFPPTGTVTYSYFTNGTCNGTPDSMQTVTIIEGMVPNTSNTVPLGAGHYSYDATYNGDSNYSPSPVSACEPFTVLPANSSASTTTFDAVTNSAWSGNEVTGATAYDTSTVTGVSGFTPTGTVTYSYFTNGTCSGTPQSTDTVTLSGGNVPNSSTVGPLGAGSYSFDAIYNGDTNYNGSPVSSCEPFSVEKATPAAATTTFDAVTNAVWSGSEVTGATAYDTSTVTGVSGFTPTGTVTYSFFRNGTCNGPADSTDTVTISGGDVPKSSTVGPLGAGSYSFDAVYNGDPNYNDSPVSACEPFTVGKAGSSAATTTFDAVTNSAWSGNEVTGATAYDTSTVTGVSGFTPTGTVTYSYFLNGTCSGTAQSTDTVTISGGDVPKSSTVGPLGAGNYSFDAVYNGDANYDPSQASSCEPFTVAAAASSSATVLMDAATNAPWAGTEVTGSKAYDTATVTGVTGFAPTGTLTYTLYDDGSCTPAQTGAPSISTQTVTLIDGVVPNSATTTALAPGSYSFDAVYNGDPNYDGSPVSACEPFTVKDAPTTTATTLFDAATNAAWAGNETAGAKAYDTSTVSGAVTGFVPSGTVTYAYFTNGTCSGTPASTQVVTLTSTGSVPNSATTAALSAGSYSFDATYGGDGNYSASPASACEPFTVAAVTAQAVTAPATTPTTTPPAPAPVTSPTIAFTGAYIMAMWEAGLALLGLGGLLVLITRRRRPRQSGS